MRLPIQYALTYPERRNGVIKPLNLAERGRLDFCPVDFSKFRAFFLALEAGKTGGTMPACMNAANEAAVMNFLERKISFDMIPELVEKAMRRHKVKMNPTLEDVLKTDMLSRQQVEEMIHD
jgi:1-deoxy-D-xylulose-5-phosphate reductoisomerase